MLSVNSRRALCSSCRLNILSIFRQGFTIAQTSRSPPAFALRNHPHLSLGTRALTTSRPSRRPQQTSEDSTASDLSLSDQSTADLETTARQARQTFGETLPKDFLSLEEYAIYERLYGPPTRATTGEDLEVLEAKNTEYLTEDMGPEAQNVLLRQTDQGDLEEVFFDSISAERTQEFDELEDSEDGDEVLKQEYIEVEGKTPRQLDALLRLRQDMLDSLGSISGADRDDIVALQNDAVEEAEEDFEDEKATGDIEEDQEPRGAMIRLHPLTLAGKFGSQPSSITLPTASLTAPVIGMLSNISNKHISETANKTLGGPGLPFGPSTPKSKRHLSRTAIPLRASQSKMTEREADVFMAAIMPGTYAAVLSTLVEIRKRLGTEWLRGLLRKEGGPRILDAGAGGAGIIAWRQLVNAEWATMVEEGLVTGKNPPVGKSTVVTGSQSLRHRSSRLLEDTTFLPRMPDYIHTSDGGLSGDTTTTQRKHFDLIIAPHTIWPIIEEHDRKDHIKNLWALLKPSSGVLALVEKGVNQGFKGISYARQLLLDHFIIPEDSNPVQPAQGRIIAPCTTHNACPMATRSDTCHVSQRYTRPIYLQRLLGAKFRNHEDVSYSYLAVQRAPATLPNQDTAATDKAFEGYLEDSVDVDGEASPTQLVDHFTLPRTVLPPMKRKGHVIFDFCTPEGKLERWTVPRSFSRVAFHDARKSNWGDLWALGAKTRIEKVTRGLEEDDNALEVDESGKITPRAFTPSGKRVRKTRAEKRERRKDIKHDRRQVADSLDPE
jgi:ribosomal protein RSM22 (predicted rRNA methylase)